MSSTLKELSSDRAVDGKSDHDIAGGSCASTIRQNNPWFRVDLENPTKVQHGLYDILNNIIKRKYNNYKNEFLVSL